jgi:hypothetical protein
MRGKVLGCAIAMAATAVLAVSPAAAGGTRIGRLECHVRDGQGLVIMQKERMSCTFTPVDAPVERYVGTIRKYGLTIGVPPGTVIVWTAVAGHGGYPTGSLAGEYAGISSDASARLGVGANALIGGSEKSVALQPVSVGGGKGLDIAVAITDMDLDQ